MALSLAAAAVVLAVGGAISFQRFITHTKSDPGFIYRERDTFEKLFKLAREAEDHGDRGTAVTNYRFLVAVGAKGDSALAPYVAAAQAGLERLSPGASDTPPSPRR